MTETGNSKVITTPSLTTEQAEKNYAKAQEDAIKNLTAATAINEVKDEDGVHHYWMGFDVPEEMLPILGLMVNFGTPYLNNALKGNVYKQFKDIAERTIEEFGIKAAEDTSRKAGLAASAAVSGLLVGLPAINEVWQGVSQRSKARDKVYKNLADVLATSDYKHNEVIQTALERTNKLFGDGVRRAMSELPIVLLNTYYAHKDFKSLTKDTEAEEAIKKGADIADEALKKRISEIHAREKKVAQIKLDHFKKETGVSVRPEGHETVDEAIEKQREIYEKGDKADPAKLRKFKAAEKSWEKLEQELEQKKLAQQRAEAEGKFGGSDGSSHSPESRAMMLTAIAGASQSMKATASKKAKEEGKTKCAYDLIMALNKELENGYSRGSISTQKIIDIFQANEVDRGRAKMGPQFVGKFQPLAKRIGEVIGDGELSPLALVNLVGEGEVVNHRRFVSEDELEDIINKQRRVFGGHDKTSLEDFLADFTNPEQVVSVIKDSLKELKGKEKAMFAALLPDDVLFSMGVKKEEAIALRRAGHDLMYEFVKKEVVRLANEPNEELEKLELSKEQISGIKDLAKKIEEGKEKDVKRFIESSKNDKDNIVFTRTIVQAGLKDQLASQEKPTDFWAKRIRAEAAPKKTPKEIIEEREGEQDMPKAEVLAQHKAHNHQHSHGEMHH